MTGGMYLIHDDDHLVELTEQPYDSEHVLQALLAKHPNLLAGGQLDPIAPRRWLLIRREMPLPSEDGGADRWSVDHLFLDQDGVPTLVEVKRSTDTRIRREVIGQALDYLANAVVYWPVERLRTDFEATCAQQQLDPSAEIVNLLEGNGDEEAFWQRVKTNLQAGRIRLLFVADTIPSELRRVVEFLNSQMDPAEVLAVEIKQYVADGMRTLVPRVIGRTERAQQAKATQRESRQWDEASFFEELTERRGPDEAAVARAILEWARERLPRFAWGRGRKDGSFMPVLDHDGRSYWPIAVWTYGRIEILFQYHVRTPPFDDEALRLELLDRLNRIPGVALPKDGITRRPSIPLSVLVPQEGSNAFFDALNWCVDTIQNM